MTRATIIKKFIFWVGLAMSLYQLSIGYFGTPLALVHRPIISCVLLAFLYLTVDYKGQRGNEPSTLDIVLAVLSLACGVFALANSSGFVQRYIYLTPVKPLEYVYGIVFLLLVLEAGRRAMGWVMTVICSIMIAYVLFGHLLPGALYHRQFSLGNLIEQLTMTTEGCYGSPTHSAVTVVYMFILFGACLTATKTGEFFMDLSLCLTGRFSGATAKTAVVSSGLMGMIQGSSISNVVTTGTFTIPAMKKAGFPSEFAGAVETVASCGGQIMPPVMGAAAFIMADYTGIAYSNIIKYAIIPAILYYACSMLQVHFRSKKLGMKGLPKEDIPRFIDILKDKGVFLLPVVLIIVLLLKGYTPMRAGFIGTISNLILAIIFGKNKKQIFQDLFHEFGNASGQMTTIIAAVLNAGIIVGGLFMTSLGMRLSSFIVSLAGGHLILGLLFAMVVAIVLGMGMPTSAAYIVMATLVAPGLVKLGLTLVQAHMFVLYFACMSMLTPPVAIAAYAAASIAQSNPSRTGFTAWKLAFAAFIVPYMFAYGPDLLMLNGFVASLWPFVTAITGCLCLAIGIEGFLHHHANLFQRGIAFIAAFLLINTNAITDVVGLALFAIIAALQFAERKKIHKIEEL